MNRVEIKNEAKELLRGNIWNIWKPLLVIYLIELVISLIGNETFTLISGYLMIPLTIGYMAYILNIVRKQEFSIKKMFNFYHNILPILGVSILTSLIIFGGTLLFIVPGIIFLYMYAMVNYLLADGSFNVMDTLAKSKQMMKGYKMDYFIFNLSFVGWVLLSVVTLGIALIYFLPYYNLSQSLYYEKLRKLNP